MSNQSSFHANGRNPASFLLGGRNISLFEPQLTALGVWCVSQLIDEDDEALMALLNLEGSKPGKICASFEDLERHRREEEQRKAEEEARKRLEEEKRLFAEARKNMASLRVRLGVIQ